MKLRNSKQRKAARRQGNPGDELARQLAIHFLLRSLNIMKGVVVNGLYSYDKMNWFTSSMPFTTCEEGQQHGFLLLL
jgi:hypothetical protein